MRENPTCVWGHRGDTRRQPSSRPGSEDQGLESGAEHGRLATYISLTETERGLVEPGGGDTSDDSKQLCSSWSFVGPGALLQAPISTPNKRNEVRGPGAQDVNGTVSYSNLGGAFNV